MILAWSWGSDAGRAVRLSETWKRRPALVSVTATQSDAVMVPDAGYDSGSARIAPGSAP